MFQRLERPGTPEAMRKGNFALRLQPSLLEEARRLAEAEGVALNQLINLAVAEKVSALRTENYIAERASRANVLEALKTPKRAGMGHRPVKGDELSRSTRKKR
jgi:HicB family